MYFCRDCNTNFTLTSKHIKHISVECEKNGIATTLIICPGCHKAIIIGGESDWDEISCKPYISRFSRSIDSTSLDMLSVLSSVPAFVGEKVN
jgi:hypothetical protein